MPPAPGRNLFSIRVPMCSPFISPLHSFFSMASSGRIRAASRARDTTG